MVLRRAIVTSKLTLAAVAAGLAACSAKSPIETNARSSDFAADDDTVDTDDTDDTDDDDEGTDTETGGCAGLRLAAGVPAPAEGKSVIVFQLSQSDVDPCSVSGYVVGQQDELKMEDAGNGVYFIPDVPPGEHDVVIQAQSGASSPTDIGGADLLAAKDKLGIRLNALASSADKTLEISRATTLKKVGAITGKALLEGQAQHDGILVAIPGTSWLATTDDEGKYRLDDVVPGDHDLNFSHDQYVPARIGSLVVPTDRTVVAPTVTLYLNRGFSSPLYLTGASVISDDPTVATALGFDWFVKPSGRPVKMKLSLESGCPNTEYAPFKSSGTFQFPATQALKDTGVDDASLHVCITDKDNTQSELTRTVHFDLLGNEGVPAVTVPAKIERSYAQVPFSIDLEAHDRPDASVVIWTTDPADPSAEAAVATTVHTGIGDASACGPQDYHVRLRRTIGGVEFKSAVKDGSVDIECFRDLPASARPEHDSLNSRRISIWAGDRIFVWGDTYYQMASMWSLATGTWSDVPLTGAPPRQDYPFLFNSGGRVIVFGGQDENGDESPVGGVFNLTTETWSAMAPFPASLSPQRSYAKVEWLGDRLVVFSGQDDTYEAEYLETGAIWDPATNVWTEMSTRHVPVLTAGMSTVVAGRFLVVYGGHVSSAIDNGVDLASGAYFDPVANAWTPIPDSTPQLVSRFESNLIWSGTRLYAVSGRKSASSGAATSTAAYWTFGAPSWTAIADLPTDSYRFEHVMYQPGRILALDPYYASGVDYVHDVYAYDETANSWAMILPEGCEDEDVYVLRRAADVAGALVTHTGYCAKNILKPGSPAWEGPELAAPAFAGSGASKVMAAGDRYIVYEKPVSSYPTTIAFLGYTEQAPLHIAWLDPEDRRGLQWVAPGETAELGFRIVNGSIPTAGGTVTIDAVSGPATIVKASAALPAIAGGAAKDVPAAGSVSIAVASDAGVAIPIVVTLSYETVEGYTGKGKFELYARRPSVGAALVDHVELDVGASGTTQLRLTNQGSLAATITGLTVTPTNCLESASATPPASLAAGASTDVTLNLSVSASGTCAGKKASAQVVASFKNPGDQAFTSTSTIDFVVGSFTSETVADNGGGGYAIPDGAGSVQVPLVVATTGTIERVTVELAIDHTAYGDLQIDLAHPNGSVVRFELPSGMTGPNVLTFDKNALAELERWRGAASNGTWTLTVRDWYNLDVGTLDSVKLTIEGRP